MTYNHALTAWPDTTQVATPPAGHPYAAALWLLGRYPQLAVLVARVSGVVERDRGKLRLNLDDLANAVVGLDAHRQAWREYEADRSAPYDDAAYDRWRADGPKASPQVDAIAVMSDSEQTRLRLLATFSFVRIPLRVADFSSFDTNGAALLADWHAAAAQQ